MFIHQLAKLNLRDAIALLDTADQAEAGSEDMRVNELMAIYKAARAIEILTHVLPEEEESLTPDDRVAELKRLADDHDTERAHACADDVLCELLIDLGYGKTVAAYGAIGKWYA